MADSLKDSRQRESPIQ